MNESEALLRLAVQYLSLGQTEAAAWVIRRLHDQNPELCIALLHQLIQLNSDLAQSQSGWPAESIWRLVSFLRTSEVPNEKQIAAKAHFAVLVDDLNREEITPQDVLTVKESMENFNERLTQRLIRRKSFDERSLLSAVGRIAKIAPELISLLPEVIRGFDIAPATLQSISATVEKGCTMAVESLSKANRSQQAMDVLKNLRGHLTDYSGIAKGLVYQRSSLHPSMIAEASLSNCVPQISAQIQAAFDVALASSDDLSKKEIFFPAQEHPWKSTGYQEARVHGWHTEGLKLETVLKEISLQRFDVLKSWKPKNRRLTGFVALMGWDLLSVQNTTSTFPLKKELLQITFPRLPTGRRSEFAGAVTALYAEFRFAELLEEICSETQAARLLTELQSSTPQTVLSQRSKYINSEFIKSLANLLSKLTLDLNYPLVRDLQLILSAGLISCLIGFMTVVKSVFDGQGQIPGQEAWLTELTDLTSTIHVGLCAMQGSYIHAWLLTLLNSVIKLYCGIPTSLAPVKVTFMAKQQRKSLAMGLEVLKVMADLISVLRRSLDEFQPDSESWLGSAASAHIDDAAEFYDQLESALTFLINESSWKFLGKANWREFAGFLMLPGHLHKLLASRSLDFPSDTQRIISSSDAFREGRPDPMPEVEKVEAVLDIVASRKLDSDSASLLIQMAMHCMTESEDPLHRMAFHAAQRLAVVLESRRSFVRPEIPVVEVVVRGIISRSTPFISMSNSSDVRKILEHFKAITRLRDALKDLRRGELRYLSGLLHNLSRALADDISQLSGGAFLEVAGFGPELNPTPERPTSSRRSYLSMMVNYLAEVGDIISTMDDGPSEGHDYFAMLHQSPQDLLAALVGGSHNVNDVDHAMAVSEVVGVDLAHEVLTTWLMPIYPPSKGEIQPPFVVDRCTKMPSLEAMNGLATSDPPRVMLACALASLQIGDDLSRLSAGESGGPYEAKKEVPVVGVLSAAFECRQDSHFPTLKTWVDQQKARNTRKEEIEESEGLKEIRRLLKSGPGLRRAMRLADEVYKGKPPDELLAEIVVASLHFPEADEADGFFFVGAGSDSNPMDSVPVSWTACLKIADDQLAFDSASIRVAAWSIDRAIEFYSLRDGRGFREFVERLKLFQRILSSPLAGEFHVWTDINELYDNDSSQLVRRLLTEGLTDEALEVVEAKAVPQDLLFEAHAAHVRALGQGSASDGKGPIAAARFLSGLSPKNAFEAGMKVLTSSCPLNLSRLLVHYLMSVKESLSAKSILQLEQARTGIDALHCLPQQWAERCAHLVETPSLIVESLVMAQQTASIKKLMEEVPSVREDALLVHYARKAVGLGVDSTFIPAFMDSDGPNRAVTLATYRKTNVSLRQMSSIDMQQGVCLVQAPVLTGIPSVDEQHRIRHSFRAVPNITLFRVLMDLLSSPDAAASAASRAASDLADNRLTQIYSELDWNAELSQDFQEGVDICLEILNYAEGKHQTGDEINLDEGPSRGRTDLALRMEVELLQKLLTAGTQVSLTDLREQMRCETLLHRLVTAEQYHLAVQTARQCAMDDRPYWEAWVIASIQEGNFLTAREWVPYAFCIPAGVYMDHSRIRMEARQAAVRLVRVLEMTCPVDMPAFFALMSSLKQSRLTNALMASAKGLRRWMGQRDSGDIGAELSMEAMGFTEGMRRKDMIGVAGASTLMQERIRFCEELLTAYAPSLLVAFMFRHSRGEVACKVIYPSGMEDDVKPVRRKDRPASTSPVSGQSEMMSESDVPSPRTAPLVRTTSAYVPKTGSMSVTGAEKPHHKHSGSWGTSGQQSLYGSPFQQLAPLGQGSTTSTALINGVDPEALAREVENVNQICDLSVRYMTVEEMVTAMMDGGPRGSRALNETCIWMEREGHYRYLYHCQTVLRRLDAAGETCIKLSWKSADSRTAVDYLQKAKSHFQDGLDGLDRGDANMKISRTREELIQLLQRVSLQMTIYENLLSSPDLELTPAACTMFADSEEPTDADLERRLQIVEWLVVRNFTLAFHVMSEFSISAVEAYCRTVEGLALERKHKSILDLINNIKGTLPDVELNKILHHAVAAYTVSIAEAEFEEWTYWFAEGLVELMTSPHAKVKAYLKLGSVDSAYKLAQLHGARSDLHLVLEAARQSELHSIIRKCEIDLGRTQSLTSSV